MVNNNLLHNDHMPIHFQQEEQENQHVILALEDQLHPITEKKGDGQIERRIN